MHIYIWLHKMSINYKLYRYRMAGNIGVELYLAVGEIKLASPNFNPPTLFYCIKSLQALKFVGACFAFLTCFINIVCYQWWYIWYSLPFVEKGSRQQKFFMARGLQWQSIHFPSVALFPLHTHLLYLIHHACIVDLLQ